jgi:hypothetical protein
MPQETHTEKASMARATAISMIVSGFIRHG